MSFILIGEISLMEYMLCNSTVFNNLFDALWWRLPQPVSKTIQYFQSILAFLGQIQPKCKQL